MANSKINFKNQLQYQKTISNSGFVTLVYTERSRSTVEVLNQILYIEILGI